MAELRPSGGPDLTQLLLDDLVRRIAPAEDLPSIVGLPAVPRPTTDGELEDAVWDLLRLRIPKVPVKPGHASPWEAFCDAYFARSEVSVWLGARAVAGKSFTLAVLSWMEAVTLQASVSILGGSGDQSKNVLDYLTGFWSLDSAPRALLKSEPTSATITLAWKNAIGKNVEIRALMASQRSARGGHPERLRLDECDEMEWDIYKAVTLQPMGRGNVAGHIVCSSTHHNPDGTMTKILREAAEKGWRVFQWGYDETLLPHGWLTRGELERKRKQVTSDAWRIEVEMEEPSAEGRAFATDKIVAMFALPMPPGVGQPQEGFECELEAPIPPVSLDGRTVAVAQYATGVDWGQTTDYTEIVTFRTDVRPKRLVAYRFMRRRAYPEMVAAVDARVARYPGPVAHDYTGVGRVGEFMDADAEDVTMVGQKRRDLFREYVLAVEYDEYRSPDIARLRDQHKFARTRDLYGAGENDHPPDGVVACAMGHRAATNGEMRVLNPGVDPAVRAAVHAAKIQLATAASFMGTVIPFKREA